MKKTIFLLFAALVTTTVFWSCNDSDGDYPSSNYFATVKTLEQGKYYFELDNGTTLFPSDVSRVGAYEAKDDRRAIIYFNTLPEKVEGYDHNIALYAISNIFGGTTQVVTTEAEVAALPNDMNSFGRNFSSRNYLTISTGLNGSDLDKHEFTLVQNKFTPINDKNKLEGYLNLELRHNANGDTSGPDIFQYVSIKLEPFKEDLVGKKGIMLRVHTRMNGVQYIPIELPTEE